MLGSSYGSTNAASIDPATGKRYGPRFPDITVSDIVAHAAPAARSSRHRKTGRDRRPVLWRLPGVSMGGRLSRRDARDCRRRHLAGGAARTLRGQCRAPARRRCRRTRTGTAATITIVGGVLESMIQIRIATLKTYGIETRLARHDVRSRADRGGDPRGGGAMGAAASTPIRCSSWRKALRGFDVTARARQDQGEGALRAVAHRQTVSARDSRPA